MHICQRNWVEPRECTSRPMGERFFDRMRKVRKGVVELTSDDDGTADTGSTLAGSGQFCCPVAHIFPKED